MKGNNMNKYMCPGCGKRQRKLDIERMELEEYCELCSMWKDEHNGSLMGIEVLEAEYDAKYKKIMEELNEMIKKG